ncbi:MULTISPECIES: cupin domain-containing protein [Pseudomonas syringae group]|uniref:cupin domain-containing protein n=1 Tax=Pseudomonas syringae group TaxID=136849 RepID=UPI0006B91C17|nr:MULTISPECIES: cupin domain-containing protein [Pseudomonas syringae group]KPB60802.1 putative cupin superfamily enzyme [Pseudomonas amygdali pv. myricae]KPX96288.1 putative cupin superfamily enzyme [Pseudomonas amygdali pv. myricae]KWS36211.1 cupin [Pseudomonas syringae pv. rhaphiolepidis]KWS50837.1 cupin [Pseudomonas amygdali pv. myricae]RMT54038.1 putative cupin superfamily enzyme [Pseudomonas amygdali pv. myricae]
MPHPTVLLLARADLSPVDTEFTTGPIDAHDPFDSGRRTAFVDEQGIAAGIVELGTALSIEAYPYTEMLVMHRGSVTLISRTGSITISTGESAVIGRGTQVRIEAQPDSLWAFCGSTQANGPDKPGITALDRLAMLTPSSPPDPAIMISALPQCRSNNLFEDTASTLRIGVWDSTPYERISRPHKIHELMNLIEGSVVLSLENGQSLTVNTGDTVFVAQGAPCKWTSTGYVRKFYAVT